MKTDQDQQLERLKQRRDKERSEAVSFRCVIPPTWNDVDLLLNRLAQVEQERFSKQCENLQAEVRSEAASVNDFRSRAIQLCKDKAAEWHAQYDVDVTGDHDDKVYYARAATELATELEKL